MRHPEHRGLNGYMKIFSNIFKFDFIKQESISAVLLGLFSVLALLIYNSPLRIHYNLLQNNFNLGFIINDGLMALFFFMVGLEIKQQMISGELNSAKKIALPAIAALFGMIFPAVIYIIFNYHNSTLLRGWAIPTATDIAFTLAVINLLGSRIPLSLKIFITALAIFDDLGAIIIIALFYANNINLIYLASTAVILGILWAFNYFKIHHILLYIFLGLLLWVSILKSGIHPTISGVLLALMIPTEKIKKLENILHPWVAYLILPLFAFINMGISLEKLKFSLLLTSVPLGIIVGLFLGKSLGIFSAVYITVKSKLANLPQSSNYKLILGASCLCGIGFTMSIFIGDLAFEPQLLDPARIGIIAGSFLSGLIGYYVLKYSGSGR